MDGFSKRGVPLAMQRDGWWLSAETEQVARRWRVSGGDGVRLGLLAALIALADVLVWQVMPGLSLALFAFAVFVSGLAIAWPRLATRTRIGAASGLVLCLLPLVELVQPLSMLVALCGLSVITAVLAGVRSHDLVRAALRLWWVAPGQSLGDGARAIRGIGSLKGARWDLRSLVMAWALPAVATLVFAALLAGANPVLDHVLTDFARWQPSTPDMWRLGFWGIVAAAVWPVLVTYRMRERLQFRRPQRATVRREGVVNAGSVARSLVAFNALFAVQTGMDALYLYGDATLPEGISPASYAHRGAYPLLATALLAGVFAVVARPHLGHRPIVRMLMMLWLAQTLALVFASIWRLDLYVEAFGLTRLRLAAYVWMGVVAVGLGITAQQIWQDRPAAWMLLRSGALGAVVLYACTFVNFDGVVARYNLTHDVPEDREMLCKLGEGAMPAIVTYSGQTPFWYCHKQFAEPLLFHPTDWREWGFRNWRVRRSLAAMTPTETPQP
ncbi:DUF4153 domain-containing protein [uncultured Tateyamaria sp.]|uniref:DUF4153 domain-containing protein n=1 Tax=Tateyamaria sp. 1078 TaxID=3417464 RepID=UPI00263611A7|nr:DUF4173 domain-containing protein [uncultured Tateyamaria sp.]